MLRRQRRLEWMRDGDTACQTIRKQMGDYQRESKKGESPWKYVTRKPGIVVWRVNKKQLEIVPENEIGTFYDGDTYLILHTIGNPGEQLIFDIYMWIGSQSTCVEYGFCSFMMIELDHRVLKDGASHHRETQNYESEEFQALFPSIKILKGGYESGFRDSKGMEANPRLFHISGVKNNVKCVEISYRFENLNSHDVFIIDDCKTFYQFNGKDANKEERLKASLAIQGLQARRKESDIQIIEETKVGMNHPAIKAMPKKTKCTLKKRVVNKGTGFVLLRISDRSGTVKTEKIKSEQAYLKDFDTNDVFIYDTDDVCYVWSGKKISMDEEVMSVPLAEIYLHNSSQKGKRLDMINEGREPKDFLAKLKK